ncbi:MAG: hypothetical protein HQL40_01445 [Alphaproteobacteria bacterium]|nr:hypothetical protein [Alphaproteobacteria bacterium]
MTYLLRHPKSHVYFLRRVVPPALRQAVGRREIRRSLRTRDLAEAKRRLMAAAAEVDRLFAEVERRHADGAPPSITLEDARNWAEDWLRRELKKIEAQAATRPIERILREIRAGRGRRMPITACRLRSAQSSSIGRSRCRPMAPRRPCWPKRWLPLGCDGCRPCGKATATSWASRRSGLIACGPSPGSGHHRPASFSRRGGGDPPVRAISVDGGPLQRTVASASRGLC